MFVCASFPFLEQLNSLEEMKIQVNFHYVVYYMEYIEGYNKETIFFVCKITIRI